MTLARRQFLHLAAAATAFPLSAGSAAAESYPTRPVRIIVPVAAGGATDILGRLLAQWLTERMGQPYVVENRPGAGGNVGTEAVVRAAPDGYTLLLIQAGNLINTSLYQKLNFNFPRDITTVIAISRPSFLMAVHPSVPARTVPEFITYAKANPGKINMASAGVGTGNHVAGEMFKMLTGVQMVHVPYRGAGPAFVDLVSGQMQMMFGSMPSMIQYVRQGTLRPLAVTTRVRSDVLPDVPTIGETVPGYEASDFYGLGAPAGTPPEIIARLNEETNKWLNDPAAKARLADLGGMAAGGSPADAARLVVEETEKWAKVVEFAGAKAD
ncbi:Bug family tripartite tricarboxylate transporter substrate binding protein [Rhodoplanes sp. Z2-YC6860]|uniref:Bug family tripartite tricarboxylate transporter substrate binding protein n=1 Tax=Rhodoplanes sp. Z2-YC6860 TaxID=674703 RepID=UPI00078CEAFB|nr:tripartite tricarboxylate transporter substrate binding protein [Rhodoplanes sp. Z2-YC6860]AMN41190.1 DHA2 family major facilitator superfamily protein [Rhodoplanes sp. Z2-YC6860]